ncbi:MAG TPA: tetratricopeptide repeat protein, partial [Povalibacter sp.]|nr:tetratricopeptide repeat protein [Povalibacter sp.]
LYGMKYMKRVGYDPWGAVTLQETFVRLSEEGGAKQQSWMEGLFASHPPSTERVERNTQTAQELGRGGDLGAERYTAQMAELQKMKPAYDKYDKAVAAVSKKDFATAKSLVNEAAKAVPREGRFQELLGEIALAEKQPQAALPYYRKAIELNPDYFGSYLGAGVAQLQAGDKARAEEWLTKSAELLPTAPAAYYLGNISRDRGDAAKARQYYQAAAGSNSNIGKAAAAEYMKMDLPQNPGNYVAAAGQFDAQGRLLVVVQNRSPLPLRAIQVTPVLVDSAGRIVQQGNPIQLNATLKSGEQTAAPSGVTNLSQAQLQALRFRVDGARIAE